jgi:hypothetical protein
MCTSFLSAQYIYKIKADSVLITNDSCNAELIIENSTKHVLGFLYNKGNGRTEFRSGSAIGDFILNQNSIGQSARMWVTGQIRTDSTIRVGQLTTDPSGGNGMIYYNNTSNTYRNYRAGGWEDFLTSGNIAGSNGVQFYFDNIYTNKWQFRLGEAPYGAGPPNPGATKLLGNSVIPMNGYVLTFNKGDNTSNESSNYTHVTSNRGITLGNSENIATGSLLRIGSFTEAGAKGSWYANETANTSPNELVHIFSSPSALGGTNGSEAKGLLIELDMGSTIGNFYGTKKPIGAEIYMRSNSNYNPYYNGDWIGLRLKSVTWNENITPRSKMYSLWADSGRVYFSDSVMIGTTNPRAKFTHDGTVSFNLGSDATGDIFYRNSSGQFTRLPIGSGNQVLTVTSGLPAWVTPSGGGGSAYSTVQEDGAGLTQRSTINFGYGVAATDNSGSSRTDVDVDLSNSESFMTSDVTLTANTYSDAVSFSLAAGTWLITGSATVESPNNTAQRVTYKLWDGTTVYQAGEGSSNAMGNNTKGYVCLPTSSIIVLTGTTTVKISVASTAASLVKATPGDNNSGTTNKATSIRAVRIK